LPAVFHSLLAGVLLLTTAPPSGAAETDRQIRTVALPPGRTLALEITIGDVRIEGSGRSDGLIEVVRHAPTTARLDEVPLVIEETATDVLIRAAQKDGGTDPALRSDVVLRVPHHAVLRSVQIAEGALQVSALNGAITADVRRGSITAADLQGAVRLETGIGDVTVERARLSANGVLRLRAFNGDVRLTLDGMPADARVLALALNGTIKSEIPLRYRDTWGPRWGEATLGKGEPVISIDVITGIVDRRVRK
jgi:hypothetical protein